MTSDDLKTYGFLLAALTAFVKVLQWLFTDKTKVALLDKELKHMRADLDDIKKLLTDGFDKGATRMQKHEDEITGLKVEMARREI